MITIRIEGTPAEVEQTTGLIYKLQGVFIVKETENYKNRQPSDQVRRYLEVELRDNPAAKVKDRG